MRPQQNSDLIHDPVVLLLHGLDLRFRPSGSGAYTDHQSK